MSVQSVRRAGARAVVLDVDRDPAGIAAQLRTLADAAGLALTDVVPGAATVLVAAATPVQLARFLQALPRLDDTVAAANEAAQQPIELRVRYDGPDLAAVAEASGLDVAEVVRRHSEVTYRAAFTGFAPGFAYLTGLDSALRLPRRSSPRPKVPAGSLAIADTYTAVYPRSSPGGWHLIGTTDAVLFDPSRNPPALLAPGIQVRFLA